MTTDNIINKSFEGQIGETEFYPDATTIETIILALISDEVMEKAKLETAETTSTVSDAAIHARALLGQYIQGNIYDPVAVCAALDMITRYIDDINDTSTNQVLRQKWNETSSKGRFYNGLLGNKVKNENTSVAASAFRRNVDGVFCKNGEPSYVHDPYVKSIVLDGSNTAQLSGAMVWKFLAQDLEASKLDPEILALFELGLLEDAAKTMLNIWPRIGTIISGGSIKIEPGSEEQFVNNILYGGNKEGVLYTLGYLIRAAMAVKEKAKEIFGDKGEIALDILRGIRYMKTQEYRRVSHESLGEIRQTIFKLLNDRDVSSALEFLTDRITRFPTAFATSTISRLGIPDDQLQWPVRYEEETLLDRAFTTTSNGEYHQKRPEDTWQSIASMLRDPKNFDLLKTELLIQVVEADLQKLKNKAYTTADIFEKYGSQTFMETTLDWNNQPITMFYVFSSIRYEELTFTRYQGAGGKEVIHHSYGSFKPEVFLQKIIDGLKNNNFVEVSKDSFSIRSRFKA